MFYNETTISIAWYWVAPAYAGIAKSSDWQKWADQFIDQLDSPPLWLINVSLAKNHDDLRQALDPFLNKFPVNMNEDDDACLGYLWQRYENNEMSLAECLNELGIEADNGCGSHDCEEFYALLTELEEKNNEVEVRAKADELLSSNQDIALARWNALHQ